MIDTFYKNDDYSDSYGSIANLYPIPTFEDSKKALHGDTIRYDMNTKSVVEIVKRHDDKLFGVLKVSSKIIYGVTKKGVPMKLCNLTDPNYPPVIVATKIGLQSTDKYVTVSFKQWDEGSQYPIYQLQSVIGNVGDLDSEREALKVRNKVNFKKLKFNISESEEWEDRESFEDMYVVSIDPPGCRDIDDALHIVPTNHGYTIGIHIADVSHYIPKDSPLDLEIRKRVETVYLEHQQINMLPDTFATNMCSLISKSRRRSFSTIIKFDKDGNILDYRFTKSYINVKRNMTYDQAQDCKQLDTKAGKTVNMLCKVAKQQDTHKMVEFFMTTCNRLVAEFLINTNIPLRIHSGSSTSLGNDKVQNMIRMFKMERAEYGLFGGHNVLGFDRYTHFTSPIRRYIDIVVHRALYELCGYNMSDVCELCHHVNQVKSNITKSCRESVKLETAFKLEAEGITCVDSCGTIVNINGSFITCYVKELDQCIYQEIYSKKAIQTLDIFESSDNKIVAEKGGKRLELVLGQTVQLQVVVCILAPRFDDKLRLQLLDPDPIDLIV